ncbi:XRE family transcriptional regulator [Streptomyces sp. NPDC005132]|uniref:XRE family transcriptional regulator n=1 Tax=Streptomyces sp. NPDC005132 TaxID=3154294 RepID=UPI0033B65C78
MRDSQAALTETLRRLDALLQKAGKDRSDVVDVEALSYESGVPPEVVTVLLRGESVPEEAFGTRIRSRITHLRETRRRPDGNRYSYNEIGEHFGSSGAAISAIVNSGGRSGPLAATQAGIESFFFGTPNGFLSAETAPALDTALQPVLRELERADDSGQDGLFGFDDVRGGALRRAQGLPEHSWKVLNATLKALLEQDELEDDR